jgi:hypothetical protein
MKKIVFTIFMAIVLYSLKAQIVEGESQPKSFAIKKTDYNRVISKKASLNANNQIIETGNGKYYALLIGISDYSEGSVRSLDYPVNDAEKLYKIITNDYAFDSTNVTLIKNATNEQIIIAFDKLTETISPEDNLLIFYAGHGYWNEKMRVGYWIPSDASANSTVKWFRNSTLKDYIGGIKSKHTLLISDACFAGGIFKTRAAFNDAEEAINKLYELPSRKAMTSGTLTEVPDYSIFIEYLLKRLTENKEKYLSTEQLFSSMRIAIINNSSCVPQYGEIKDTGDEGGDFIFIRK